MKKKKQDKSLSAFGRLMEYAGRFKVLTYLSLILSALSSVLSLLANKKILTIGDSITNRGWYQQRLKTHVPSLEFVGKKETQHKFHLG